MIPAWPPLGCDLMSWIYLYGISVVMYPDGSCGFFKAADDSASLA